MTEEKLFYKYQSLEIVKDENGKDRQYTIENLSNNQLYFQHPKGYNDPYDSMIRYYRERTEEASINKLMKERGFSKNEAIEIIEDYIREGIIKRDGDLLITECHGRDDFPLPLTCCFSKESGNILMWSHYANYHKGVCLCFKAKLIEGYPHLTINSKAARLYPIFYEKTPPSPINFNNQNEEMDKFSAFLSTKSKHWEYEQEHRMFLTEKDTIENLNKFEKEELEGVILGIRINSIDASQIYETINEHYLKKGVNVNFYVEEVDLGQYKVQPKKIDIKTHIIKIVEKEKLHNEIKRRKRINSDISTLYVGSQESWFININRSN
jgi:hypothetical protein